VDTDVVRTRFLLPVIVAAGIERTTAVFVADTTVAVTLPIVTPLVVLRFVPPRVMVVPPPTTAPDAEDMEVIVGLARVVTADD
jgi:hypothetical protein